MKRRFLVIALVVLSALAAVLVGCGKSAAPANPSANSAGSGGNQSKPAEVVVYSGRKEAAIKPVLDAFASKTGIKVTLKTGKTGGLLNQIIQEKSNPQGDVFISTAADAVIAASRKDQVFEAYNAPESRNIPAEYRSADGTWVGIYGRARIILYNTDLVKGDDIPKSVLDLADPKWKGKIAIAGTVERTTLTWLSYLVEFMGEEKAGSYVDKLQVNGLKILGDNSEVRKGVAGGEFALGLTNSPNYYLTLKEGGKVGVVYPDQGEGQMGTLVNANTVSIIKGARNVEASRKLVDFLLTREAQQLLAEKEYEIPLVPGVRAGDVKLLGEFKAPKVNQEKLADLQDKTIRLFPKF